MSYVPATNYVAKIGGVTYKNVGCPVAVDGKCLLTLARNESNNQLVASFDLTEKDGSHVASVIHNKIVNFDTSDYFLLRGKGRTALVDKRTWRVWCDIISPADDLGCEIWLSCIFFVNPDYPIYLHPNYSKFGLAQDFSRHIPGQESSYINGLNLSGPVGNTTGAGLKFCTPRSVLLLKAAFTDVAFGVVLETGEM